MEEKTQDSVYARVERESRLSVGKKTCRTEYAMRCDVGVCVYVYV